MKDDSSRFQDYDTLAVLCFAVAGLYWHVDRLFAWMLGALGAAHVLLFGIERYRNRLRERLQTKREEQSR